MLLKLIKQVLKDMGVPDRFSPYFFKHIINNKLLD
jgi:hypothetical protein